MAWKRVNAKTLKNVLANLVADAASDSERAKIIAEAVDAMIDDLVSDDFFGTEAQCDPRGDQRDITRPGREEWS